MSVQAPTLWSPHRERSKAVDMLIVVAASVAVGVALVVEPLLAAVPIAALAALAVLSDGRARLAFVLFGGLFLFQRDEGLTPEKLAFLSLFVVAALAAAANVKQMMREPVFDLARPVIASSIAVGALGFLSFAVSYRNGIPPVGGWLRDVAPHLLFACAPIFALDAVRSFSRRGLVRLIVVAGAVGTAAYVVYWLDRRGIAHVYASRLGLASHFVPAALFAYAMALTLHARRWTWFGVSSVVLGLLVTTGTRTTLALLAAPAAAVLSARTHLLSRAVRLGVLGPLSIVATLVLALVAIQLANADEELLTKRIEILRATGTAADSSYVERTRQSDEAWSVFTSQPILGAGPGTIFEWDTLDGYHVQSFLLDTPLTFPAKFGLVGLAVLLFVVIKYWDFLRRLRRGRDPTVGYLALAGYLAVAVVTAVTTSPLEDKGFSFGLMLLLALALHDSTYARRAPSNGRSRLKHADA